jgi:hypothetical protein
MCLFLFAEDDTRFVGGTRKQGLEEEEGFVKAIILAPGGEGPPTTTTQLE